MNDTTVSIIMPTFNRGWCIERAINSVLNQSNSNWELIIVDDASTDNTEKIIKKYLTNNKVKYQKELKNNGAGSARNIGIGIAKGDYLVFFDSDDELKDYAVAEVINIYNNLGKKIKVVMFATESQDKEKTCYHEKTEVISYKDLIEGKKFKGDYLPACRKEIFENKKHRFPELPGGLEGIFWYGLAKEYDFLIINKVLLIYHTESDDRITGIKGLIRRAEFVPKLYDDFFDRFEEDFIKYNPKKLGYFYLEKAIFEILNNEEKIGRKDIRKSITYNQKNLLIGLIIFVASYLPIPIFFKLTVFGHRFLKLIW